MGDGRIVKPIGIARNLEVLISGKHRPTDFFIVDVYYDKMIMSFLVDLFSSWLMLF
jgi:hypothetical protein